MNHQDQTAHRPKLPKFVRVVGTLWLAVVIAVLLGALLAPYVGRMADFFLHHTLHRDWIRLRLQTEEPFFDLSTPIGAVKSYYSALYQGDATRMERLTHEPLRRQMHLRLSQGEVPAASTTYRSYLHAEQQSAAQAIVVEKFHFFWQRGLRFYLQRHAADWRILRVALLQ